MTHAPVQPTPKTNPGAPDWIGSPRFTPGQRKSLENDLAAFKENHALARENFRRQGTVENEIKMQEAYRYLQTFIEAGFRGLHMALGTYNRATDGLKARQDVVVSRRRILNGVRASGAPIAARRAARMDHDLARAHLGEFKACYGMLRSSRRVSGATRQSGDLDSRRMSMECRPSRDPTRSEASNRKDPSPPRGAWTKYSG